jgi:hypothetical protein
MSNEFRIQSSYSLRNGNSQRQSLPNNFQADQTNPGGPTPGQMVATKYGNAIDLTALNTPGICWIINLDAANFIEVGPYDPASDQFQPVWEFLPGEFYTIRLSRLLGMALGTGSGTGTDESGVQLWAKGVGGDCQIIVEAYER